MNKKSELFTIGMILLFLLSVGIFYYEGKAQNQAYVGYIGDDSIKIVYFIRTNSKNCNLNEVKIDSQNLKLFNTLEEAKAQGFTPSKECS